jgi:putative (di)nucleoside polyphosphate hydrolase
MPHPALNLPFRRSIGICLFNKQGDVFCAERRNRRGAWQMPQGGIQRDELSSVALFREMKEEIGTNRARIVGRVPELLRYIFPDYMQFKGEVFHGKYRGQEQIWYALQYLGTDAEISLAGEFEPESPEFIDWRWAKLEEMPGLIVDFKKPVYDRVVETFLPLAETLRRGETLPDWKPESDQVLGN